MLQNFHCSNVSPPLLQNGNLDNPHCNGIEGILEAYHESLKTVQLYGPTNFAPVVNHVAGYVPSVQDSIKRPNRDCCHLRCCAGFKEPFPLSLWADSGHSHCTGASYRLIAADHVYGGPVVSVLSGYNPATKPNGGVGGA